MKAAGKLYEKLVPAVVIVVVILLALVLLGWIGLPGGGRSLVKQRPQPDEFMYLDSARVGSYVGQLNGGNIQSENRQEVTTQSANVGLELDTVGKANATSGSQLTRNVVVNQSAADRFAELLEALKARGSLKEFAADSPCSAAKALGGARVGSVVAINSVLLQMPTYLSAYPELRYASYRFLGRQETARPPREVFGPTPLSQLGPVTESVQGGRPRKEREEFKRRVGANPRIPFSFSLPATATAEAEACRREKSGPARVTVVLPARFANITGDPELLSAPLTLVGKVVSNVKEEGEGVGPKRRAKNAFGDGLSLSAYWPALSSVGTPFLRELGVREEYLRMPRPLLRARLFGALERSLSFAGHVIVVVPVAIYD